jgi:hypothetical protein
MKLKPVMVAAALALSAASSFAVGSLDPVTPSASFSNTVSGTFNDIWTFNLGTESIVAASITNVAISFGSMSFGEITNFTALLNGVPLLLGGSSQTTSGVTVSTQVLAGSSVLPAGFYQLKVSGTVVGATASYGGNIVATPVSAVPEPETYAMLLAGLGAVGFVARRRRSA